jgi:hypothetical protein
MNHPFRRLILVAVLVLTASCATMGANPGQRGHSRLITQEQIRANHATNAYELVQTLRPTWLQKRGAQSVYLSSEIAVYHDEIRMGGPEALRSIPVSEIARVEYFDASSATQRWGTGHPHGAIRVVTRV